MAINDYTLNPGCSDTQRPYNNSCILFKRRTDVVNERDKVIPETSSDSSWGEGETRGAGGCYVGLLKKAACKNNEFMDTEHLWSVGFTGIHKAEDPGEPC